MTNPIPKERTPLPRLKVIVKEDKDCVGSDVVTFHMTKSTMRMLPPEDDTSDGRVGGSSRWYGDRAARAFPKNDHCNFVVRIQ